QRSSSLYRGIPPALYVLQQSDSLLVGNHSWSRYRHHRPTTRSSISRQRCYGISRLAKRSAMRRRPVAESWPVPIPLDQNVCIKRSTGRGSSSRHQPSRCLATEPDTNDHFQSEFIQAGAHHTSGDYAEPEGCPENIWRL